jgi:hypothetical protein
VKQVSGSRGKYTVFESHLVLGDASSVFTSEFSFEAKAVSDIHVAFMTSKLQESKSAWEVVFGGWNNTKSVIRFGTQGKEIVTVSGNLCIAITFRSFLIVLRPHDSGSILSASVDGRVIMESWVPSLGSGELFPAFAGWDTDFIVQNCIVKVS